MKILILFAIFYSSISYAGSDGNGNGHPVSQRTDKAGSDVSWYNN